MRIQTEINPYLDSKKTDHQDQKSIWNQDFRLKTGLGLKEKTEWYQLLSTLINSGLGILDSLSILTHQKQKKHVQGMLEMLKDQLESGLSFSGAMAKHPQYFSSFEIQSISMGEETGNLGEVLSRLSHYYRQRLALKRKVLQALSYPVSVIVVAMLVMGFMLNYVVPMFQDIFQRFDAELPPVTEAILAISDFFQHNTIWILLIVSGLVLAIFLLRNHPVVQKHSALFLLRLPFLGKLILRIQLSRVFYSLGLLLNSKINLDHALALTASLTQFYPLKVALEEIKLSVVHGQSLSAAIEKHPIFPDYIQQIIKVGDKTARHGELISDLAHQLEEESQAGVGQLTQFLEPVLIILLGGIVGLILVSMYLPMFELGNSVIK